jgi:hypothetical protein
MTAPADFPWAAAAHPVDPGWRHLAYSERAMEQMLADREPVAWLPTFDGRMVVATAAFLVVEGFEEYPFPDKVYLGVGVDFAPLPGDLLREVAAPGTPD